MARNKNKRNIQQREYLPWIEKYRPRKLEEIAAQKHVVSTLKGCMMSANLTHLLFYGPPGTGKTSTILALARQLYGPTLFKSRVLELNASDERGINVVRTKIKNFAQYTVNKGAEAKAAGFKCPPYKIIILDEADSMTRDAQTALRRTMEKYSNITRFCLICNYVSRIIAPVASRCSKFRFQPLSRDCMLSKLREIGAAENLQFGDGDSGDTADSVLNELVAMSGGDMRKSITLMQSASLMKGKGEEITLRDVHSIAVRIPREIIEEHIVKACLASTFGAVNDTAHFVIAEGYPVAMIMPLLLDFLMDADAKDFTNLAKAEIALRIAEADKKMVDGASEFLQLLSVMSCIFEQANKK